MSGKFTAQVEAIVAKSEKRMTALARESIQDVINDAQLKRSEGGRMRIDIGFLRASGQGSYTGMPTGPSRPPADAKPGSFDYNASQTETMLAQLKIGAVFYFGWTAFYAKYREAYDGFLGVAVQKWPDIVKRNTEKIKARIK